MALQNLRSNTANKRPTASGMVDGQVAINTNATNPGLFFKDASDGIRKVGPVFIGSSAPNSSPATGGSTGHSIGEQWLDTSSSRYVVKTWDGTAWRDDDSNYLQLTGGALSGALTIDNAASVSALDLKFDGDTDTGFYAPAANTLGFVGGGTERVRINSSGNVGIGTTSPSQLLEISGSGNAVTRINSGAANTTGVILSRGGTEVARVSSAATAVLTFSTGSSASERMRIDSSGNVGIGTTSPSYPLHVNGNAQFGTGSAWRTDTNLFKSTATGGANIRSASGSASTPIYSAVGDEDTGVYFPETNAIAVSTAGSQRLLIDSLGRVGINTTANQADLDVNGSGAGTIRLGSSSTSRSVITHVNNASNSFLSINADEGDNSSTNTHFKISVDNSERLRITSNGNVGIGDTSPDAPLHVTHPSGSQVVQILETNHQFCNLVFRTGNSLSNDLAIRATTSSTSSGLGFITGNTERMTILNPGNVGIGTTTPGAQLEVKNTGNVKIYANSTGGFIKQDVSNLDFLHLVSSGQIKYQSDPENDTAQTGHIFECDGSEKARIDNAGNVGIGTSSPSAKLHVAGTTRIGANDTSSAILEVGAGATGNRNAYIDLTGDTTYSDFGLRIIRNNGGANATSVIDHRGTGTLEIKTREAAPLVLSTNATERVRVTSDGSVGIGVNNPGSFNAKAETLVLANGGNDVGITLDCDTNKEGSIYFADGSTGDNLQRGQIVYNHSGDSLRFVTNASERMRINSSGNVGIGTTTPESRLEISRSTADDNTDLRVKNFRPGIRFVDISNNAADGEIVVDGGSMRFRVSQETNASTALTERMRVTSEGRVGIGTTSPSNKFVVSNSNKNFEFNPGTTSTILSYDRGANAYLAMKTRALTHTWSSGSSDYLHINSSGQLGVGTTSPTKKLHVNGEAFVTGNTFFHSTNSAGIIAGTVIGKYFQTDGNLVSGKTTTSSTTHQTFCNPNGIVGTIRTSGSATQYNTSSDYRLKENVVDIADGITRVKQLQPKRFNFIADADTIVDGFIAHEAQTVVPEAVSGTHNEVDEDGEAVMQGIDQSKLVPLLTAALKEAIAKIETLETKVAALEAQ